MYCPLHKKHHHQRCARKSPSSGSSSTSSSDSETLSRVDIFRSMAEGIKSNRDELLEKFPKVIWLPHKNDIDWCSTCLGSKLCLEIYGEQTDGERATFFRKLPYRKLPVLSIVLHLQQERVILLLKYLHQWFLLKGLKDLIAMWMYALFACLDNDSIDRQCSNFLKNLLFDFKRYAKTCEIWQKPRATLLMDILEDYFLIYSSDSDSD